MGKVKAAALLQNANSLDDLKRFVGAFCDEIVREFNGRIVFGDNIQASGPSELVFTAAGELELGHSLGRLPSGFLVINKTAFVDVRRSSTTWTSEKIYLTSNGAATVTVLVI